MNTRFSNPALSDNERINVLNSRGESNVKKSVLSLAVLAGIAAASVAQAADDQSLTMYGITLYGTYDIGVAYQSHGAPLSQDFYPGLQYLLGKSSRESQTSIAPSGLSQSKVGLRGKETINDDLSFVFNGEVGFNPQSGKLADAPKSLIHNNGIPLTEQKTAGDGSRAGQFFNGQAWAGLSSKTWGTLTFGRHVTPLGEIIVKYDPMNGSYAFSPIGYSGMTGGMGNTEDVRLDDSVKYAWKYEMFHIGALYQWGKNDSSPGEAWQGDIGFDYAGFAVDGVYGIKKDALALGSLSAAQLAGNPAPRRRSLRCRTTRSPRPCRTTNPGPSPVHGRAVRGKFRPASSTSSIRIRIRRSSRRSTASAATKSASSTMPRSRATGRSTCRGSA